jgi:phosphoenolpyruvate---glycerone phosphotransferase subunit DhaL
MTSLPGRSSPRVPAPTVAEPVPPGPGTPVVAPDSIGPTGFGAAIIVAGRRLIAARDELGELDARAGDGDLGVTLATGYTKVIERIEASPVEAIGSLLVLIGRELARSAPSTMGTLLATSYLRAGATLGEAATIDSPGFAAMLEAMAANVAERGRVVLGQRTALDAMRPAADVAATAAGQGRTLVQASFAAAEAARLGSERTAGMEAQVGRAGWIADRARGTPDAGAVAWAIFLAGLADGLASLLGADPERA